MIGLYNKGPQTTNAGENVRMLGPCVAREQDDTLYCSRDKETVEIKKKNTARYGLLNHKTIENNINRAS